MSTKTLASPNRAAADFEPLASLLRHRSPEQLLKNTSVDWENGQVSGVDEVLWGILQRLEYVLPDGGAGRRLSRSGLAMLGRLSVNVQHAAESGLLSSEYQFESVVATGKNSVTFVARHRQLHRRFVVKAIRPGCAPGLADALQALATVAESPFLVRPVNVFQTAISSLTMGKAPIDCLVFEYVSGRTLDSVLTQAPPQSPFFVPAYIRQVASGLSALQQAGLHHGDLHAGNIIVSEEETSGLNFKLIDVSYGIGLPSRYEETVDDYTAFCSHLRRILIAVQRLHANLSLQRHLRARLWELVTDVLRTKQSFHEIERKARTHELHKQYRETARRFVQEKFHSSDSFGTLRFEEIGDPNRADKLFEPFHPLFEHVSKPQNTVLFGPRGSGKSTYLGALAFAPDSATPGAPIGPILGVFFACRQGELRQLSPDLINYTPRNQDRVRHLFVLKMTRRLLYLLVRGVRKGRLLAPTEVAPLADIFEGTITKEALGSFDSEFVSPLENLHSLMLRAEASFSERIFSDVPVSSSERHLGPPALIRVCEAVHQLFPETAESKICFLFDDAGAPNVPVEAQRILNDFLTASNSVFCLKLSAERYSYELANSAGEPVPASNLTKNFDLAHAFSLGAGNTPERVHLEQYLRAIVTRRLVEGGYQSKEIVDYLGPRSEKASTFLAKLRDGSRSAYYAGWETVWQLSDRNPRQLLELVSHILAQGEVRVGTPPRVIDAKVQDKAIRALSERWLLGLRTVSGTIAVGDRELSRGRQLYNCTATFGKIARSYLLRPPLKGKQPQRHWELLGLERDDEIALDPLAELALQQLVRAGVFDDSSLGIARDDGLKKPVYVLNRILCPFFGISYRRHINLRLSHGALNRFLLEPEKAFRRVRSRLKETEPRTRSQYDIEFPESDS